VLSEVECLLSKAGRLLSKHILPGWPCNNKKHGQWCPNLRVQLGALRWGHNIHKPAYECYMILTGNTMVNMDLQRKCRLVPLGKKLQPTPVGYNFKKSFSLYEGAITFFPRLPTCTFSTDSVRAYVFWQLLCKTYALTPYGSKVMMHGVGTPGYQGYGEKFLVGSYLKDGNFFGQYLLNLQMK